MKKHTLSLIGIAAATLFATSVQAQVLNTDRSFDFNVFFANKMAPESMISKEQFMKEMEKRWMMADKMMGEKSGKGMVSAGMLMKAMKDFSSAGAQ
jgi:hypothetical protein